MNLPHWKDVCQWHAGSISPTAMPAAELEWCREKLRSAFFLPVPLPLENIMYAV
jgi:hypothetical protein